MGFQTTYEELKRRSSGVDTLMGGPCFQTTYEELKPRTSRCAFRETLSFQTTYEELKLVNEWGDDFMSGASRLPMRN